MYTSRHLSSLFDVTIETIRLWSIEFASYLSSTANPGTGKARQFSQDDLEVLTLVADLKGQGMTFADIHANLKSGQRGKATVRSPEDISQIAGTDPRQRLMLEVERLRRQLVDTQSELEAQRKIADQALAAQQENARLEARLEVAERERERLEKTTIDLSTRIEHLAREAGREYAKGFIDAMREKNNPDQS